MNLAQKTTGKALRALIVEDSEKDATLLVRALRDGGYEPIIECVDNAAALQAALREHAWDIIFSDHDMPGFDSLGALQALKNSGLSIPFVIVSGGISDAVAAQVIQAGARAYIKKTNMTQLLAVVAHELQEPQASHQTKPSGNAS